MLCVSSCLFFWCGVATYCHPTTRPPNRLWAVDWTFWKTPLSTLPPHHRTRRPYSHRTRRSTRRTALGNSWHRSKVRVWRATQSSVLANRVSKSLCVTSPRIIGACVTGSKVTRHVWKVVCDTRIGYASNKSWVRKRIKLCVFVHSKKALVVLYQNCLYEKNNKNNDATPSSHMSHVIDQQQHVQKHNSRGKDLVLNGVYPLHNTCTDRSYTVWGWLPSVSGIL